MHLLRCLNAENRSTEEKEVQFPRILYFAVMLEASKKKKPTKMVKPDYQNVKL